MNDLMFKIWSMNTVKGHILPCSNSTEYYVVVLEYVRRVLHPKKTRMFVHKNYGKTCNTVLHAYRTALLQDYKSRI